MAGKLAPPDVVEGRDEGVFGGEDLVRALRHAQLLVEVLRREARSGELDRDRAVVVPNLAGDADVEVAAQQDRVRDPRSSSSSRLRSAG